MEFLTEYAVFLAKTVTLVIAILVVLVSIGLVLVTPDFDLASGATIGLLWSVGSGLLFSLLSLTNRASSTKIAPVQAALCQNVVVAVCLLPVAAPGLADVRALDWLWIGLLGVFCTGLAHSLFVASLAVIKARTASRRWGQAWDRPPAATERTQSGG